MEEEDEGRRWRKRSWKGDDDGKSAAFSSSSIISNSISSTSPVSDSQFAALARRVPGKQSCSAPHGSPAVVWTGGVVFLHHHPPRKCQGVTCQVLSAWERLFWAREREVVELIPWRNALTMEREWVGHFFLIPSLTPSLPSLPLSFVSFCESKGLDWTRIGLDWIRLDLECLPRQTGREKERMNEWMNDGSCAYVLVLRYSAAASDTINHHYYIFTSCGLGGEVWDRLLLVGQAQIVGMGTGFR